MHLTFAYRNISKNGVTKKEIEELLASELSFADDLSPSLRGNDRIMVIGWTYSGRILEIGGIF